MQLTFILELQRIKAVKNRSEINQVYNNKEEQLSRTILYFIYRFANAQPVVLKLPNNRIYGRRSRSLIRSRSGSRFVLPLPPPLALAATSRKALRSSRLQQSSGIQPPQAELRPPSAAAHNTGAAQLAAATGTAKMTGKLPSGPEEPGDGRRGAGHRCRRDR